MSEKSHVALTKCFFCGGDNEILLHSRLGDISAAHGKIVNTNPCSKCKELMAQGVILLGMDESKSGRDWNKGNVPNPYRTGDFIVMKDDAVRRMINDPTSDPTMVEWAIKHRWMFCQTEVMQMLMSQDKAIKDKEATNDGTN